MNLKQVGIVKASLDSASVFQAQVPLSLVFIIVPGTACAHL